MVIVLELGGVVLMYELLFPQEMITAEARQLIAARSTLYRHFIITIL